jgi:hypothetical protein
MHKRTRLSVLLCSGVGFAIAVAIALGIVSSAVLMSRAVAMDREELRNVNPLIRKWFEQMRSPQGKPCCSYADGFRTEYDMKENHYWIPIDKVWHPVPPEVVIYDQGNPFAEAVVWYNPILVNGQPSGNYDILCFVPGGGS